MLLMKHLFYFNSCYVTISDLINAIGVGAVTEATSIINAPAIVNVNGANLF